MSKQSDTGATRQAHPATAGSVIEALWLLTILLVPLWVNLWGAAPFAAPKVWLLRTLVWIAGALWLSQMLRGQFRPNPLPRSLKLTLFAYAIALLFSTVFSVDPNWAWWGNPLRANGALTQLSYLLFFVIPATSVKTSMQRQQIVTMIMLSGAAVSTVALLQAFGWNPANLVVDGRSALISTLGRANFTGAFLAMTLPFVVTAWMRVKGFRPKLPLTILILLQLTIIGLTRARGAWFGLLIGACVLAAMLSTQKRWRNSLATLAGLGIVGGFFAVWQFGTMAGGSIAARATMWPAALSLIRQRPWLGYGMDSLGITFPTVYPPQLVFYEGRNAILDRAHNLLLDQLLTTGLIGTLLLTGLILLVLLPVWRRSADDETRWLVAACCAALATNWANNVVSFNVVPTALLQWLLLGMLAGLLVKTSPNGSSVLVVRSGAARALGVALVVAVIGVALFVNGRSFMADYYAFQAQRASEQGAFDEAATLLNRAVVLQPGRLDYRTALSFAALQMGDFVSAENQLQTNIEQQPTNYRHWTALAQLYGQAGQLDQAYAAFAQAAELAPDVAIIYGRWGQMAYRAGDFISAETQLRHAIELDTTDSAAQTTLGYLLLEQANYKPALTAFGAAIQYQPRLIDAYLGHSQANIFLENLAEAEQTLVTAQSIDPNNLTIHTALKQLQSEQTNP